MNMNFDWKKMASFAAVAMATGLNAIPPDPCEPVAEPLCCTAPIPGPFAFAYPYDLGLNCPRDFYFHIDGLAFQAKQDGMEFAIQAREDTTEPGTPIAPITYGKVIGFGFSDGCGDLDYNPGARVGLGFYLDHDAWNIDMSWTWVHVTNYKSVHADHDSVLIPLWLLGSSDTGTFGNSASASWSACYNVFDVSLAKPYYVSRYLVLNPFFGARAADIHQEFSVHYAGSTPDLKTIHHGEKNEFRGVGARFGVNSDWILGKGWWLFANVSTSILAGKFEIHQKLNTPVAVTDAGEDGFDLHSDYFQNTPNMEIALGLAWSRAFDCNRYIVGLRASYEFVEWWDQFNMRKFFSGNPGYANDVVSRGNLTLNGFSLRLQLDL